MSKRKKNATPPDPDAIRVRMSKFSGIKAKEACDELRRRIIDICVGVSQLPGIKGTTQYEEIFRQFRAAVDKAETSALPHFSDGIGSKHKSIPAALASEVSCMIYAYWQFREEANAPNAETVHDHMVYLSNLLADPKTLRVEELKNCRYRAVNSRIDAGERLNEAVE